MFYKADDKVIITDKNKDNFWNMTGSMDQYVGKVVTIRVRLDWNDGRPVNGIYHIKEDSDDWLWRGIDFEPFIKTKKESDIYKIENDIYNCLGE